MRISYYGLLELIEAGIIDAPLDQVQGATIDVTLHEVIALEDEPKFNKVVNLKNRENISTYYVKMNEYGYQIKPGQFILGATREMFNLPNAIEAEFMMKSSIARNGLWHALAGYCDPGWSNSRLTLEMKNETEKHILTLNEGLPIGQVKFNRVSPVPDKILYKYVGQYNNQDKVTPSKGVRIGINDNAFELPQTGN